jgi:hypothetical protein
MLHCDCRKSGAAMAGANTVSANRLKKQAARCQALAKQTHDEDGRRRYLRLEQMYLQLADAEERSAAPGTAGIQPAA